MTVRVKEKGTHTLVYIISALHDSCLVNSQKQKLIGFNNHQIDMHVTKLYIIYNNMSKNKQKTKKHIWHRLHIYIYIVHNRQ